MNTFLLYGFFCFIVGSLTAYWVCFDRDQDKRERREKKILKNCGCCCYCECRNPLNDGCCITLNESEYEYTCSDCGGKSVFNFDIAPVPIRISYEPKRIKDECRT